MMLRTAIRLLIAAFCALGLTVTAGVGAANAHHGSHKISNSIASSTYIVVHNTCYNRTLDNTTHRVYPGGSTDYYDKGFLVPRGWTFDAYRNGVKYYSNNRSDGRAYCIGSDNWHVLVRTYVG